MDFIAFIKDAFLVFPTDVESFVEKPYLPSVTLLILYFILSRRFEFLLYFIISLAIFICGFYFGVVTHLANTLTGSIIFGGSSVISVGLLIYKLLIKH